jgi:hypothetical protein
MMWGGNLYGQLVDDPVERRRLLEESVQQEARIQFEQMFRELAQAASQTPLNPPQKPAIAAAAPAAKEVVWLKKDKDGQYR